MAAKKIRTKTSTFGTCSFGKISPSKERITESTKTLNVFVSFEDALKLNLAISEALRKLNSYNRSTKAGKSAAMNLTVHLESRRLTVNEGSL